MLFDDFEFILQDRIVKIQSINKQYDLENNSYISFSGGKDSVVLSKLIDLALPNNNIPRVYINTGIEYIKMVNYVKFLSLSDSRIFIINQSRNIPVTLKLYGYPFKSKEHSDKVFEFKKGSRAPYLFKYLSNNSFSCPNILRYQFTDCFNLNISKQCCYKLKKELAYKWQFNNNKSICITGMRRAEKGLRSKLSCLTNNNKKFHPLSILNDEFMNYFVDYFNIKLCDLYYAPYNFKRTGCKGCPFNKDLQIDLDILYKLLPNEYYQCLHLWKPVYDEYIRIGYRLKYYPHINGVQTNIFDFLSSSD